MFMKGNNGDTILVIHSVVFDSVKSVISYSQLFLSTPSVVCDTVLLLNDGNILTIQLRPQQFILESSKWYYL
jgi:hypothetical protein